VFITRRFIACSPLSYPKLAAISLTPGSHIWYPHRWRFERPGWAREFGETSSPAPSNATRSAKQLETGQVRDWASQRLGKSETGQVRQALSQFLPEQ
jgi:hypothetical protein